MISARHEAKSSEENNKSEDDRDKEERGEESGVLISLVKTKC